MVGPKLVKLTALKSQEGPPPVLSFASWRT